MLDCSEIEDPFGDELGPLIRKVIKIWQRLAQKSLDEFDITPSQMELLGAIVHLTMNKIEPTQIALSQETSIDPMTTSTILRNLQKKGLITRKESKTDTRARIVQLTEEGETLFMNAIKKVKKMYEQLTSEDFDREVLKKRFESIYNSLSELYNHL